MTDKLDVSEEILEVCHKCISKLANKIANYQSNRNLNDVVDLQESLMHLTTLQLKSYNLAVAENKIIEPDCHLCKASVVIQESLLNGFYDLYYSLDNNIIKIDIILKVLDNHFEILENIDPDCQNQA